ncbi:hypothetical protein TEQG_02150 [Trichophyton equinum CBS 127.97]|uniref:Uncharacterized protein n=1 Tax=Trichophyton equinum (strain ATCC MYA-4606 / CBS 127.97) TaxID=559882 RepID=F2PML6_TRIEC|nr:hypothetical protein TEQG_02150 [Trichophyton equinum CBS 127.97]
MPKRKSKEPTWDIWNEASYPKGKMRAKEAAGQQTMTTGRTPLKNTKSSEPPGTGRDEAGPGEQQSGEAKEQPRRPSVRRLPTAYPPMGQSEALVLRERSMVNGIFGQGEEEGVLKQAGSAGGREPRVRDATTQADGRCSGLSATAAAQKKEAEVNLHGRQKTGHKDRPKNRQKGE